MSVSRSKRISKSRQLSYMTCVVVQRGRFCVESKEDPVEFGLA